jgi:uncharacterized repeat protein (TIGR04138 family)
VTPAAFPTFFPVRTQPMQKLDFGEKLDLIVQQDPRFDREAYLFLRDALDFTVKLRKKAKEGAEHVSGQQLLEGIRLYALKQYGPMVPTVFGYWGVTRGEDFGDMVFNFIREGVFGKTDTDSIEDFSGGYNFHDAFVVPYLPEKAMVQAPQRIPADLPAEELN